MLPVGRSWGDVMNSVPKVLLAAALLGLGGCATVVKGSSQDIAIDSSPQGASCEVTRQGVILGQISATPAKFNVSRDKDPLVIACKKPGHAAGQSTAESKFNGATLGNILLGGVIGVVVDASTGANYTYPEQVMVALPIEGETSVMAPSSAPAAAASPAAPMSPAAAAAPAGKPAPAAKPAAPAAAAKPN